MERVPPEMGGGYDVADSETGQTVHLDALGAAVLAELDRPRRPADLVAAAERVFGRSVPAEHVLRRVRTLSRTYLLDTPRWERFVERAKYASASNAAASAAIDAATVEFRYRDELRHACQACGGCCSGADVGPLPQDTVRRIEAYGWGDRLPALQDGRAQSPFRHEILRGESIWLTEVVDGACIFQREDKLCSVHAEMGEAAKPTICRQFPYHLTALPDGSVAVSIQMECRAWLRAKRMAEPTSHREGELRELIAQGAFVQRVAEPVELRPGVALSWREAAPIEAGLTDLVERARTDGAEAIAGVPEAAAAFVRTAIDAVEAEIGGPEPWLQPEAWGLGPVAEEADAADRWKRADALRGALRELVDGAVLEFEGRGDRVRAGMHRTFLRAADDVLRGVAESVGHRPARRFRRLDGGLDEVLVDHWRSGLMARDAWFQRDLQAGVAQMAFRHRLIEAGAAARAEDAVRVEILGQDAVDSMVVTNKMARQWSVSGLLRAHAESLRRLFAW